MKISCSADELKAVFDYDKETGGFRWKIKPCTRVNIGDVAGDVNGRGYKRIRYKNKECYAHHLAWLFVYGEYPEFIDHIDGNKLNNAISNLRLSSPLLNQKNRKKNTNNKSSVVGVCWVKREKKWKAQVGHMGAVISLGLFNKKEDAIKARKLAEVEYGFLNIERIK